MARFMLTWRRMTGSTIWDWDIGIGCAECGASLWEDMGRAFSFAPHRYLCFECATRRGGLYDPGLENWMMPPDVRGLPFRDCAERLAPLAGAAMGL